MGILVSIREILLKLTSAGSGGGALKETQIMVPMDKGGRIALYRLDQPDSKGCPLIITHGTISNADTVRGLGCYLAESGFDCWLLEWGGHGDACASGRHQDFEYPAFNDLPAALGRVLEATGKGRVYWVSHSGGGHLPLMYLARYPELQEKFVGIVAMGAQATDAAQGLKYKARALALKWVTSLLGRTPKQMISVGTEGEPTRLLAQWSDWNLSRRWTGKDGFDYMAALAAVTIPVFMLAGSRDDIAPVSGCRKFYDNLGSRDKSFVTCSVSHGFRKDYTHGQLIRGRAARAEIYPRITAWLEERNRE